MTGVADVAEAGRLIGVKSSWADSRAKLMYHDGRCSRLVPPSSVVITKCCKAFRVEGDRDR